MNSDHSRPVVPVDGGHWPFPWPAVFELENTVGSQHWSLIGGLMVQLHCFANNVEPTRATTDIDMSRTQVFEVTHETGMSRISTPDIVGALVLKGEAYRVDSRDRERHLMDAVTLALLLDDENSGTPLHGTASRRMRRLIRRLDDPRACDRAGLNRDDVSDAIIALEDLLDR